MYCTVVKVIRKRYTKRGKTYETYVVQFHIPADLVRQKKWDKAKICILSESDTIYGEFIPSECPYSEEEE